MAFQIKDFQSILASMVNYVRGATGRITDFNRGSVARTLLEAPAIEMDQMYQELFSGIREGVETSLFRSFDLELFDDETFEERQRRFALYVNSLAKAIPTALESGAMTTTLVEDDEIVERVRLARAYEPYTEDTAEPVGFTELYVHNGVGATSAELVARAQQIIDGYVEPNGTVVPGYKGAGLPCPVIAATDVVVNAEYEIGISGVVDEAAAIEAAEQAVSDYMLKLGIGKSFDPDCGSSAIKLAGVRCIRPVLPEEPVEVDVNEKVIPGTITVTATVED